VAVVASPDRLLDVAHALVDELGGLLVPGPSGLRWPHRLVLEARVRALTPILPWDRVGARLAVPPAEAVVVVERAEVASALGLRLHEPARPPAAVMGQGALAR
jgi:hypothetical protein